MASVTCPNCQTVAADGTVTCPGCGNALPSAGAASSAAYTAPPSPGVAPKPQIKFDLAAVSQVDRLVGGGTLVLFIALFLPWFKVSFSFVSASASGLTAHGYLYITLIVSLAILGLVLAEALGLWKLPASAAFTREQILLAGTVINFVLVLIAFLLKPGGRGVGWDFGAFIALAAAVVALSPLGWPIIQARRGK
jgi:hypothetical protein